MATAKLKPCPFCGAPPTADEPENYAGGSHYHYVACYAGQCPATPTTGGHRTAEAAAEAWNARQPEQAQADILNGLYRDSPGPLAIDFNNALAKIAEALGIPLLKKKRR